MLHLLLIEWGENMQMQIGKPIFHEEISASAWRYWERLNFRSRPRQEVEWSSNSIWRSRRSSGADREEWIVNKQRRISLQGGERRLNRLWTWLWNGSRIYGLKSLAQTNKILLEYHSMRECNEFNDHSRILLFGTDHWANRKVGSLILFALFTAANMLEQTPIHQFVCIFHNALKFGAFVRKSTGTQHPTSLLSTITRLDCWFWMGNETWLFKWRGHTDQERAFSWPDM